ncbi:LSM1 protein [Thecamonas trahens ATCC 50062]|uniref:U6 snRNA-associated Sm-like protein LSm1 n=1 Tax=Thecamonas trahens ATCC 50062 TaxID=461836 RepID=A0A0L0D1M0_THETB|nr:LSM1 protein [Thecamonas trahens ATCC 50062]KNC46254.1 LSM1 protein [Thecamonas trahens ATCC 50062]|eukprot:XP_013760548.1 LSM1 protein [Thecamonas trahens ATCC 50062]
MQSTEDQFIPGAASLRDELDQRMLVVLRDGKTLEGYLRSYDQFSNLVLEETVERVVVGPDMATIDVGTFVVRGDTIMLMGKVDGEKLASADAAFTTVDEPTLREKQSHVRQLAAATRASRKAERLARGILDDTDLDAHV